MPSTASDFSPSGGYTGGNDSTFHPFGILDNIQRQPAAVNNNNGAIVSPGLGGSGGGSGGIGGTGGVGDPGLFKGAVAQQAGDYDSIMAGYKNLGNINITPQQVDYEMSPYQTESMANLSNLAQTGGYSDQNIQDIRARSLSPIRSIYASAQSDLQRQKALAGGYAPGSAAASTKMARDLANTIGQTTTNVNAGIAQNVAQNKLSIAPTFASATQNENNARLQTESHNADMVNAINEFNAGLKSTALAGQTSLYGTTPALANMFGNQALQSRNLDISQQQVNQTAQERLISMLFGGGGGGAA